MLRRLLAGCSFVFLSILITGSSSAQPLLKSVTGVDSGNTKAPGGTFTYRLVYNCSSTSGPCLNAQVVDLLPIEVQEISTVPASPTSDVAAINVTPNFMGSGRTRVQFVMNTPLPAGNSGDLLINVRFPNGSTPDGTVATNTADGINLGTSPGTFTTPPVSVTAVATVQTNLQKTLQTSPANLDLPETYRLRISVPNNNGALNLTSIGPVVDTLHPGTVFNGATPAADCQPGCVGTTPASVTWTSPCSLPLTPGGNCDISVNVTFPSGTFPSGTNITNTFTTDATPLGKPSQNLGVGQITHPVTTFVPAPGASLSKGLAGGTPNPPTLNQTFSYDINVSNNGNVPLDTMVITDTLPIEMQVASVTTGAYSGFSDFASGVGVRVTYEKNTALSVFTLWGSSPNTSTNTTLTAPPPGLGGGEYITRIRWEYGQAATGASTSTRPVITGQIINPDHAGGPVAIGDTIQNCSSLNAVYTPGPTNVTQTSCNSFILSGPFVQLNPAKDNLSGGPFNPGQTVSWRLRVRSAPQSSDPVPLQYLVATDLLPVDLVFSGWTFDDQGTGLPAPQNFSQIPNFAGTGRTLLRWTWNAGSGNLAVNQQVWINISTTVRDGAFGGPLSNDFTLDSDAPSLGLRCSGSSQADPLDYDGDANTAETLCRATGNSNVSANAHLISSKTIQGTCDGGSVSSSSGTLVGGGIHYTLRVQNDGTVSMQNFVLIDILPFVGDTGVRDTNPRGSQWSPLLAAPIIPPSGTTLYYSTSGNPCRGEVGGPTTSCDPPNWTTVPPNPITSVRSFKVEFGDRVVDPFDFVSFQFVMTTPGNINAGLTAYNSFAYQADRADGLGPLAAEPQKVGIALGSCDAASLGDYVWVDTNHDGIQNDGPTGLNNVYVQLFSPGTDGVAGTFDDVPLASTITGPSPTNEPGWYSFPGLAPGTYFVKITPPPTYAITLRDTTTEANDSDSFPNGAAAPVTLAPNEHNPNIDFGLFPTAFAAAGNYVWFDRNSDGIQNEPTTDGVNGVTVRLYLDDGDGTPEPGGNDPLQMTTVTANDVYGRPGYYLFDGLVPGLPYFIQFVTPLSATGLTSRNSGGDDTVDSDASLTDGTVPPFFLAPNELNPTFDAGFIAPSGTLSLGDQVWNDPDNDGVYEPQNGEVGIDGVRLDLYTDVNNDAQPTLDEFAGSTTTATNSGFAGRYLFDNLAPGNYIVVVAPQNFGGGGALSGLTTSTGNDPTPDPDDDVNGDDNGAGVGAIAASRPVTLSDNGEPTAEDGNNDSNLTVDFGFTPLATAPTPPVYDYGDAPDVGAGTSTANYNTTALDNGPFHLLGVPSAPHLGPCVDDDNGFLQNTAADEDDTTPGANVTGTCTGNDDEDGVTFSGSVTPGSTASFSVSSGGSTACVLDAWVDWNQNGVFGDSGEQIATSLTIPTGAPTVLNPSVPAGAIPGVTYARFRCSTGGGLPPTGSAPNGEVEDYRVTVIGHDFGDDPASYGSADHVVDPLTPLYFGSCVDTEPATQPSAGANGDDNAPGTSRLGSCFDDENGILFDGPLAACGTQGVSVTSSGAGILNAWIDFNADGDFNDPGEQIFTNTPITAGANSLSLAVPCTATGGATYSRFRVSTSGGLTPTSNAPNGEVEDYPLTIAPVDFGDAPNSYNTTFASNGPRHAIVTGYSLGATVDSESDGQPNVGATGDGADEDGVIIPSPLLACSTPSLTVTVTNTAGLNALRLDAWIDFAGDGTFDEPGDRIATALSLSSGANNVPVTIPCSALSRATYARFRLSSLGVATPTGPAGDGEIEDYAVTIEGLDFGDLADPTFPTLLGSNGARHAVLVTNNPTLGSLVDTEPDGAPSTGATGDDATGSDDEDGITFPNPLIAGMPSVVHVTTGATGGNVNIWIDYNQNGSLTDAGEHVLTDQPMTAGASQDFAISVPVGSPQGNHAVRARISSQTGLGVSGLANDGEIEDHLVPILPEDPHIGTTMRITKINPSGPCGIYDVTFEVGLANTGNVTLTNVNATTVLSTVFVPPATYSVLSITSTDFPVDTTYNGNSNTHLLLPGVTLEPGESGIIQFVVHLDATCAKVEYELTTTGEGTSPAGTPVTDPSQDGEDNDPDNNGNPSDNNDPTVLALDPVKIPTLDEWGLIAITALLAAIALRQMKS